METKTLKCDMTNDCKNTVSYIDNKGFIYCETHGKRRQYDCSCRKLRSYELNRIRNNKQIKY